MCVKSVHFCCDVSDDEDDNNIITTGASADILSRLDSGAKAPTFGSHHTPSVDLNQNNNQQDSPRSVNSGSDFGAGALSPREHRTSSLKDNAETVSLPSVSDIHSTDNSRRQSVDSERNAEERKLSVESGERLTPRSESSPAGTEKIASYVDQDLMEFSSDHNHHPLNPDQHMMQRETAEKSENGHGDVPGLIDVKASCRDLLDSQTPLLPNRTKKFLESPRNVDDIVMSSLPDRLVHHSLGSTHRQASPVPSKSPSPLSVGSDDLGDRPTAVVGSLQSNGTASTGSDQSEPVSAGEDEEREDSEATLEDIENGTQTARLIEFQNGSFSEFVVKTPSKSSTKNSRVILSQSVDSSALNLPGEGVTAALLSNGSPVPSDRRSSGRQVDKHSVTLPQVLMSSVDSETDSLIARYRQLRLASQEVLTKGQDSSQDNARFSADMNSLSPKDRRSSSSLVSEKYLRLSPEKDIPFQTGSRSLDNSQDSSSEIVISPPRGTTSKVAVATLNEPGLEDDDFADVRQSVLAESPFATPSGSPRKGKRKS